MKNHFISLFVADNLKKTIILFVISVLLISISSLVGISDNIPMIIMLFAGIIFLFFTVLHPWKKATYFAILIGVFAAILIFEFLGISIMAKMGLNKYINEGIGMSVAGISIAGIFTGIIGVLICSMRKK